MSNLHPQTEMQLKEELYEIYYSITQILNISRTETETQEMIDKIQQSDPFQILNYIRELINILTKTTTVKIINQPDNFDNEERRMYENTLRKYESDIRYLIQKNYEYKFQMEVVQNSLDEYAKIEEEYEEMKEKFKYEKGKFLQNERKDNEIIILRAENTNLKKIIDKLEGKESSLIEKLKQQQTTIKKLTIKNENIYKQLADAEKELSLLSNMTSHDKLSTISPNKNMNLTNKSSREDKIKAFTLKKLKAQVIKKNNHLLKHRNNSLNMLVDTQKADLFTKYFTNKQYSTNSSKKCSIESHLMSNYNPGTSHKNLKFKKMPFQMISNTKNLSSRNSNSTKQLSNEKKFLLSHNRNSNNSNAGLIKPSASFG